MAHVTRTLAALLLTSWTLAAFGAEAGFNVEHFTDSQRNRPIVVDWWYPAQEETAATFDYGFSRGRVVEQGQIAAGR